MLELQPEVASYRSGEYNTKDCHAHQYHDLLLQVAHTTNIRLIVE